MGTVYDERAAREIKEGDVIGGLLGGSFEVQRVVKDVDSVTLYLSHNYCDDHSLIEMKVYDESIARFSVSRFASAGRKLIELMCNEPLYKREDSEK